MAKNNLQNRKKQLKKVLENIELPEICKDLNAKQIAFCEAYVASLDVRNACKKSGYTYAHGYKLRNDVRIKAYCNYLREQIDAVAALSKGQLIEEIGQRILSGKVSNKDLAALSREARALQGIGSDINVNTQINITLPDTYNDFFKGNKDDKKKDSGEWIDVKQD